ncbi:hypothetical protein FOXB_02089 [Fusarium oxysporum f. sp. conglutinans Fo5176]|uniref:Amino acid permease/ SLC12A domain-containing protein n=1 Tax=Fusarium oxysporum (strain Fo5176) TaxID=660025 RepID=F9F6R4_FUSOF|nr:hypothetical protein FOXB_02089 [Fusarium oxysporum f. sp. conglutinans Fo5176]
MPPSNEKVGGADHVGTPSSDFGPGAVLNPEQPADFSEMQDMKQGLKSRHLQMLALAGAIGTGLFLGSGRAVANAGPVGALIGYTLTGLIAAGVVLPVAEMGALVPLSGGIVRYAELFVDPALSFANGWNLVYKGLIFIPTELVAAAVLVQYWSDINSAAWITIFGCAMSLSNFLLIKVFGELEFYFALLKIALIVIVNVMSLVIVCGGGPNGEVTGFRYWKDPGPFATEYLGFTGPLGRFLGFYTVFANALYAYSGIENISLAAAETQNARRVIPQAAKRVFWRILIFYILTMFLVGLVIPSNNPMLFQFKGTAASPFVISAKLAGIKVVPHVINAIVITSAWSCGNMGMMSYIRYLFGLAKNGHAPKIFLRINRFGIPWVAASLFTLFMSLGYLTTSNGAAQVFTWLQDLLSTAILVNWSVILMTFLRFYYGSILRLGGWQAFIKGHWDTQVFVAAYFNVPFVLILYFGYKFIKKTKIIPLDQIPIRPLLEIAQSDPSPPLQPKKGWRRLNILW